MESRNNAVAIKKFFEANGGRKVSLEELKSLTDAERKELGELAAIELEKMEATGAAVVAVPHTSIEPSDVESDSVEAETFDIDPAPTIVDPTNVSSDSASNPAAHEDVASAMAASY